ncbi:MAG: CapA family protein [Chloroflexota bacterium]
MADIVLAAVGDIVLGDHIRGAPLPAIAEADLAFGNLEIGFSRRGYGKEKAFALRCDPSVAPDLARAGFGAVSLANNHVMDFGPEGLEDCRAALDRAGVRHLGAGPTLSEAVKPLVVRAGPARVAFVAFSALLPLGAAAGEARPGVSPVHVETWYDVPQDIEGEPGLPPVVHTRPRSVDVERCRGLIAQLRREADVVVVLAHWGVTLQETLAEYQPFLAHVCIDAGADAVVGCHNHMLLGCETYRGKPIFYGLSQAYFVFDHPFARQVTRETALARLIVRDGAVHSIELVPLLLNEVDAPEPGEPHLATGHAADLILSRIARQSPGERLERTGDTARLIL